MKRTFTLAVLLGVVLSGFAQAQRDTAILVIQDSLTLQNTIGQVSGSQALEWYKRYAGYDTQSNKEYRHYRQFSISTIPDNASIQSVRITLQIKVAHGDSLKLRFYAMPFSIDGMPAPDSMWVNTSGETMFADFNTIANNPSYYDQTFVLTGEQTRQAFAGALASDTMTIGFRSNGISTDDQWWSFDFLRIQVVFLTGDPLDITLTNVVSGQEDYQGTGSLVRAGTGHYQPPPYQTQWWQGGDYTAETWHYPYYISGQGTHKFDRWNYNSSDHFAKKEISNFDGQENFFGAISSSSKQATIKTVFEGYGERPASIRFRDPWRVAQNLDDSTQTQMDYFVPHPTPYEPKYDDSTYGVFLNKSYDPDDPNLPYYRVLPHHVLDTSRTPKALGSDVLPGEWVFAGLSALPQDAAIAEDPDSTADELSHYVRFLDDDAQVEATYQAHLYARNVQSTYPTANNNQRKVAYHHGGAYHAVYESNGEVYHMTSVDGSMWSAETRISDGSGTAHNPSISCGDFIYDIYVPDPFIVYLQDTNVKLVQFHNNEWKELWRQSNSNALSTPGIGVGILCGEVKAVVVWDDNSTIHAAYLRDLHYTDTTQYGFQDSMKISVQDTIISSGPEASFGPSISDDYDIAWRSDLGIVVTKADPNCYVDQGLHLQPNLRVCQGTVNEYVQGVPSAAYCRIAFDITGHFGISRRLHLICANGTILNGPIWNVPQTAVKVFEIPGNMQVSSGSFWFSKTKTMLVGLQNPNMLLSPSIGVPRTAGTSSFDELFIAYNYPVSVQSGRIDVIKADMNGHIHYDQAQTDGICPSLTQSIPLPVPLGFGMLEVFSMPMSTLGSPFDASLCFTGAYLSKNTVELSSYRLRELNIRVDTSVARASIQFATYKSADETEYELSLEPCADSLDLSEDTPLHKFMKFETFTVPESGILSFDFALFSSPGDIFEAGTGFAAQLRDALTDEVLVSQTFEFSDLCHDSILVNYLDWDLSEFSSQQVYLTTDLSNALTDSTIEINDIYLPLYALDKQESRMRDFYSDNPAVLGSVYPQPVTNHLDIRYALKEEANISLTVYDFLGRKVATLVDGLKDKGNHQVRFTAAGLNPGIYIIRLTTGTSSTAAKFIKQ